MGETGAGLLNESAITGGTALASKWDEVSIKCPWWFKLRDFHGERPNVSEPARANSTTILNIGAFTAHSQQLVSPAQTQEHQTQDSSDELGKQVSTLRASAVIFKYILCYCL